MRGNDDRGALNLSGKFTPKPLQRTCQISKLLISFNKIYRRKYCLLFGKSLHQTAPPFLRWLDEGAQ